MNFSLATFNVGLLEIFGGLFKPAPFVCQRLHALPEGVRRLDADVIALQEIYRESHRQYLVSALHAEYPFHTETAKCSPFKLPNGLMTLARVPMTSELELYRSMLPDERLFDSKGLLVSRIKLSTKTEVLLINMHTTAGGSLFHPESVRANLVRETQINQILGRADREKTAIAVIAGDLNAGPGVSEANYRLFEQGGFIDVHEWIHKSSQDVTWDPENSLNRQGPHKTSPAQRVDHVFIRQEDIKRGRVRPLASAIRSTDEIVDVGQGRQVTLSDHYSLQVSFEIAEND